jgi:hypothetical protein
MSVTNSVAAAIGQEEAYEVEGRNTDRPPPPRPSVARPGSASWPPSSSVSRAVARGPGGISVARARATQAVGGSGRVSAGTARIGGREV